MINHITVTGYMQKEITTRKTEKDLTVHQFTLHYKNRDASIYYRINLWGNRFEGILPYLKENKPLLVIGDLRPPKIYQDKKGENRVSLEINAHLIDLLPRETGTSTAKVEKPASAAPEIDSLEEEVPF